ncbi:MAG: hypothetical protein CK426_06590 [Legionella sp.]|nr:MAG: hypothetical protein CK423_06560 [Legionella sp.]PJD98367.1 MAG: hypothetical protein CK426_06590 [Legionella sp.]
MKDNLFELLLNLFEQSLSQLHKNHLASTSESPHSEAEEYSFADEHSLFLRPASPLATRVLTYDEQIKLTKASYQFLMKMRLWEVIDSVSFEQIMNQLSNSDSRIVTLQEMKWTVRQTLAHNLSEDQLTFLDLVLYQSEDKLTVH